MSARSVILNRGRDHFFTLCFKNVRKIATHKYTYIFKRYYKSFRRINEGGNYLFPKFVDEDEAAHAMTNKYILDFIQTILRPAHEKHRIIYKPCYLRPDVEPKEDDDKDAISLKESDKDAISLKELDKYIVVGNYPTMERSKLNDFMTEIGGGAFHQKKAIELENGGDINLSYVLLKDTEKADILMGYTKESNSDGKDSLSEAGDKIIMDRQLSLIKLAVKHKLEELNS